MKLPTGEVVERHRWTINVKDEHRPNGEDWYRSFDTKEEAEEELRKLIGKKLMTRVGEEVSIPEWP